MAYGVKKAKAQNQSDNILSAIGMGGQSKKLPPKAPMSIFGTRLQAPPESADNNAEQDLKLQQALTENRNVAEQLAAKRNVRRASSRQLLSSSRLETLGQGE